MSVATLHLTREEAFGLKVGGLERVTCWLTRPERQRYEDFLGKPSWGWASPASGFSARAFHVIGAEDVAKAIWRAVEETAFPGIPCESWDNDGEPDFKDHPQSVPADEWVGSVKIRVETRPFPNGTEMPITLTGPYTQRFPGKHDRPPSTTLAWLSPPRLEDTSDVQHDPFSDEAPIPYWQDPRRTEPLNAEDLQTAFPVLKSEFRKALRGRGSRAAHHWSRLVPTWIGLAEPGPAPDKDA